MISTLVLSALTALPLTAAAPQDSFAEQVKEYKAILDDRERESEAIALIDAFATRYAEHDARLVEIADMLDIDEGDPKALKKEAKDLQGEQEDLADLAYLAFKERKRDTEGHRRLWKGAIFALGQMGESGAELLWKVYGDKRFKKSEEVDFRVACVEQVGATRDWKQWEELVDLLDHHEDQIIAAAASALKNYRDAPGKIRLEACGKLVNFLNSYYNAASNPEDTTARQRYRMVNRPMLDALSEMTGQTFPKPLDWRKWYNDNKKDKKLWSDD